MFIAGGVVGAVLMPIDTTDEERSLKRAEFLHGEKAKILDDAAKRLRESGKSLQEIEALQSEEREQNDQQYLETLKQLETALGPTSRPRRRRRSTSSPRT